MRIKPTLLVNLHTEEGRGMFQLDLGAFSADELRFMVGVFDDSNKEPVLFDLEPTGDGRFKMTFTIGAKAILEAL